MKNNKKENYTKAGTTSNGQGVDKAPEGEEGKKEKVTNTDLKGKKVDGDPELESDQPVEQKVDDE